MYSPLSERFRPIQIEDVYGQEHITCPGSWLRNAMQQKKPRSILFYGPPGCGKTTLARLYAQQFSFKTIFLSAVDSGVGEIKKILNEQKGSFFSDSTILFVDEIHRFNRAQQDLFLPFMENGKLVLIGATTENPSFALNNALLSRFRVLTLNPLKESSLKKILDRYQSSNKGLELPKDSENYLIHLCKGDGRYLLNLLENLEDLNLSNFDIPNLQKHLQHKPALYDKAQDNHYDFISALHKSVRASDPDAALFWLCRMLNAGEDPLFLSRRLIRMATEDVGLADPEALSRAIVADQTYQRLGSPEGELALAQITIYLALAPKSNATYMAFSKAKSLAEKNSQLPPNNESINAPTEFMKKQGRGAEYEYDHDFEEGCSGQSHLPLQLQKMSIYEPVERGFEREMLKRLKYFQKIRKARLLEN